MTRMKKRTVRFFPVLLLGLMTIALGPSTTSYGRDDAVRRITSGASGSGTPVLDACGFSVDVSPNQVNIDSGGSSHNVRILTYTWYSNTAGVFVYINPPAGGEPIDPIIPEYVVMTRDSFGHLVVKVDLNAFQDAELETDTFHDLKVVAVLKQPVGDCAEKEGTGEIYIIGHNGP